MDGNSFFLFLILMRYPLASLNVAGGLHRPGWSDAMIPFSLSPPGIYSWDLSRYCRTSRGYFGRLLRNISVDLHWVHVITFQNLILYWFSVLIPCVKKTTYVSMFKYVQRRDLTSWFYRTSWVLKSTKPTYFSSNRLNRLAYVGILINIKSRIFDMGRVPSGFLGVSELKFTST